MPKAIITYYSYTGNTQKVANLLSQELKRKFVVSEQRLEAVKESGSYVTRLLAALFQKGAEIKDALTDMGPFDLVCIGFPVNSMGIAPPLRTYLKKISGLKGKNVVVFLTHQIDIGKQLALKQIQKILGRFEIGAFSFFSVKEKDMQKDEMIKSVIVDFVAKIK
jgi:flavodoxin